MPGDLTSQCNSHAQVTYFTRQAGMFGRDRRARGQAGVAVCMGPLAAR